MGCAGALEFQRRHRARVNLRGRAIAPLGSSTDVALVSACGDAPARPRGRAMMMMIMIMMMTDDDEDNHDKDVGGGGDGADVDDDYDDDVDNNNNLIVQLWMQPESWLKLVGATNLQLPLLWRSFSRSRKPGMIQL